MRPFLAGIATLLALGVLAACGGGDDSPTSTTADPAADPGPCGEIQEIIVESGAVHADLDFTAEDYTTNPPTSGDHNEEVLEPGSFYTRPPRLGEAVHLLEHGAVIGWTNDLERADQKAVEKEFNEIFQDGYYQLAVVEYPELDVPFALSAWGAMQICDEVDTSVIRPFVEEWYASPKTIEGALACDGPARRLPPC